MTLIGHGARARGLHLRGALGLSGECRSLDPASRRLSGCGGPQRRVVMFCVGPVPPMTLAAGLQGLQRTSGRCGEHGRAQAPRPIWCCELFCAVHRSSGPGVCAACGYVPAKQIHGLSPLVCP